MRRLTGVVVAMACGVLGVASGSAAAAQQPQLLPGSYTCRAVAAAQKAPPPFAPPTVAGAPKLRQAPVCRDGQLPWPKAVNAPKGEPRKESAGTARGRAGGAQPLTVYQNGAYYSYAIGQQYFAPGNIVGISGGQTNDTPYLAPLAGEHSISQLWAIDDAAGWSTFSTVEAGWTADRYFNANAWPTFFVYHFDGGQSTCYNGCGWVQVDPSFAPGMVVPFNDGLVHRYAIVRFGNDWWVGFDNVWLGYLPASAWRNRFVSSLTRVDAGGEVASSSPNTCSDMGNGWKGSSDHASFWYDLQVTYNAVTGGQQTTPAQMYPYASDPSVYDTGHWLPTIPGNRLSYGGGGWC